MEKLSMLTTIDYRKTSNGSLLTDGQMKLQVPRAATQIRFNIKGMTRSYMPILCSLLYMHMPLFIWLPFKYMKLQEHLQYSWLTTLTRTHKHKSI